MQMVICTLDTVLVFSMLYITSTTIGYYAPVMLPTWAKLPVIYSLSEREREEIYLNKIENSSYNQEFESHLMPEIFC